MLRAARAFRNITAMHTHVCVFRLCAETHRVSRVPRADQSATAVSHGDAPCVGGDIEREIFLGGVKLHK